MVAVVKAGKSLRTTLYYNENKVKQQVAEILHAANYGKDLEHLGFTEKLRRLEKLTSLNQRTKVNSVHISLNFDPSEKIAREKLIDIANTYMQRIGFGNQPYLVYQHHDSGHPHIHIVSTNIQRDGSRIKLHNIGRNQSEKARKEIETEFGLVQAESKGRKQAYELEPVSAQKILYGKSDTKRAVTNILNAVLPKYKYASLPELNAVLRSYNIVAERGDKTSRTYMRGGLVYRVLDGNGEKIGVPIKASHIHSRPTLKYLEQKFVENEQARQPHQARVRNAIDLYFLKRDSPSMAGLTSTLQNTGINAVLRQNDQGLIYGITYVDHKTKCVFNGSDLGKPYSSNAIQQRCDPESKREHALKPDQPTKQQLVGFNPGSREASDSSTPDILEKLMKDEGNGSLPAELKEEEKRKKRNKKHRL